MDPDPDPGGPKATLPRGIHCPNILRNLNVQLIFVTFPGAEVDISSEHHLSPGHNTPGLKGHSSVFCCLPRIFSQWKAAYNSCSAILLDMWRFIPDPTSQIIPDSYCWYGSGTFSWGIYFYFFGKRSLSSVFELRIAELVWFTLKTPRQYKKTVWNCCVRLLILPFFQKRLPTFSNCMQLKDVSALGSSDFLR